jgi:hypothetical protein
MTTSGSAPGDGPEVPAPGVDAVPPLDRDDSGGGGSEREPGGVPSDAERTGTAEDEADAARRHR